MAGTKRVRFAVVALLGAKVAAAPTIDVVEPRMVFTEGIDATGSIPIQPGDGTIITADAGTQITTVTACFDRTSAYIQYEDAFVCPGAESLAPLAATCNWAADQTTGGCLTLAGAGGTAAAWSGLAWQIRYLNGHPFGGVTAGPRAIRLTVTDSVGAKGTVTFSMQVNPTDAKAPQCPVLAASQNVDVLPSQLVGGAGVRVSANAALTTPNMMVNAHARITGGCNPAQDVLGLDYTGAPATIASTWYPETCDLTMYNVAGATAATWQAALRNIVYRNAGTGGGATLGTRYITISVGQTAPVECRSNYALTTVNMVNTLPTPSPLPSSSSTSTPIPPSASATPLDIAGAGTATAEADPSSGAASGVSTVATASVAISAAGFAIVQLLA